MVTSLLHGVGEVLGRLANHGSGREPGNSLGGTVIRVTEEELRAKPAEFVRRSETVDRVVVTDRAGNTLFTISRQHDELELDR